MAWQGNSMGVAWEQHGMCELALIVQKMCNYRFVVLIDLHCLTLEAMELPVYKDML
jgi:hypothetical protein